jgi:hypothetical protein
MKCANEHLESLKASASGTRARGAAKNLSKEERLKRLEERISGIIAASPNPEPEKEHNTGETQSESAQSGLGNIGAEEKSFENSTTEGDTNVQRQTQSENESSESGISHESIAGIQPTDSAELSESAVVEISRSTNLIGDSVKHLNGLMKSAAAVGTEKQPTPEEVNAACNCAKQMGSLMRLQVDLYREVRKARMSGLI